MSGLLFCASQEANAPVGGQEQTSVPSNGWTLTPASPIQEALKEPCGEEQNADQDREELAPKRRQRRQG